MGLQLRPAMAPVSDITMSTSSNTMEDRWAALAQRNWLKSKSRKVAPDSIRIEIWDALEAESFSLASLVALENLQILENFLWPAFTSDASNQHVLLVAIFVAVKKRAQLPIWDLFTDRPDDFAALFRRILSMNLDNSLSPSARISLLSFVVSAFQSIEKDLVRKVCAPLVSISIWNNLYSEGEREGLLDKITTFRKAWRSSQRRYEAADETSKANLRFERAWLFSMLLDFLRRLNTTSTASSDETTYCEKFVEFLVDLTSQLPTRRYTLVLLKDLNLVPVVRLSRKYRDDSNITLRDLVGLLEHFIVFVLDDRSDQEGGLKGSHEAHYASLARLQRVCMQHFETKLKVLGLSNYASIDQRSELETHFAALSDAELEQLCGLLGFRTVYPKAASVPTGRELFIESLIAAYERPLDFHAMMARLPVLPTEDSIYDATLLRNESYDGNHPLALPKLNLQYLTLTDFMWRSFVLHRSEALYEIRKDLESVVKRMKPRAGRERDSTIFEGFSKMAVPISKPAIIEVASPKVGTAHPGYVRAEIALDVDRMTESVRNDWDRLRPNDVVFLLAVKTGSGQRHAITNGHGHEKADRDWELAHVRSAEIVQLLDDSGRPIRATDRQQMNGGFQTRPRKRRLLVNIDASAYQSDIDRVAKGRPDIYPTINAIARRQARENNFKPVLETVRSLVNSDTTIPSWFEDVFLGYGDPRGASHKEMIDSVDFRDTFVDWQHLNESFPGRKIEAAGDRPTFVPPYVLQTAAPHEDPPQSNPKKRRRVQMEEEFAGEIIKVSTYQPENKGPYPTDVPKINRIRFTPKQTEAIVAGTQSGLTIVVGPPGTGKTDVATQIINLLYHNSPQERILLVAHSNQALNQLFQKIIALDIDSRHLLRLGHGEEELDVEASYSKYGRVESFLENRQAYLAEVDRMAASVGAEGAHGSSCETAEYFNQVFIKPAWSQFWDMNEPETATPETIARSFPFYKYFSNAPVQDLLPPTASKEELLDIVSGCQRHIDKVFTELEAIRPFEILRHGRDQANHLLIKEARIIAMTSTHAAMRRSEIADLGFHYDTLIMEEAAQITEMESFIPCIMQNPDSRTNELPLKRIVLVGDHLQNSPIVQNLALNHYANLSQSLFLRLIRIGVPHVVLDAQGRCRPSIANLFKFRYPSLINLPHLSSQPEFILANAGFRYPFQFIDVPTYDGKDELEPSPHFIQNLGEAEYAVALYQYMRLLGYPAKSVSILATYAGQKALIRDVLEHRCKSNPRLFGLPRTVTTVDKYQGEQNDYVILSLTRTKAIGYLRDVRRLTVALSRARLGLYVLGRRELFETQCIEMRPALDLMLSDQPDKLVVVTGEMYGTPAMDRRVDGDVDAGRTAVMEGVEHLGQYVFEMTQAKIKALGGQIATVEGEGDTGEVEGHVDDVEEMLGVEVDEDDPLHEGVQPA